MADKSGQETSSRRFHRWYWRRWVPSAVRFWFVFWGFLVLLAVVLLIVVLVEAAS